ncbi:hypothetical protein DE146DRAFT_603611 [Phaeosphaeria sp. MPI-PUGE-AT-0046c]|nr:hypothetical protein DE146DRAFT_603611 [Phaeosphaeria sp. MPI-PUGE-AT-0046c]
MPKQNTNTKTPSPTNPSSLSSRYSIRQLNASHIPQAAAIMVHSNLLHSPVWPNLYPVDLTGRLHAAFEHLTYLVEHQISSGLSYGVFDDEYVYKTPEAEKAGGKLFWDASEQGSDDVEAESKRLVEQMDFPLVSIALSYDGAKPLDQNKMEPVMGVLPHFGLIYHILAEGDKRDPEGWKAKAPGEVLMRNATSTRHDYEGQGVMSGLARWLMREAAAKGYRGIQIEALSDPVTYVWSQPEEPFKGNVVSEFELAEWKDEEGKLAFAPVKQRASKCYVELRPHA